MKKIIGQIVFFTLIMTHISFAGTYDFEVNNGNSVLEARFNSTLPLGGDFIKTGIGAVYNNDDYTIGDITLGWGREVFVPELRFTLGFRGILGDIETDDKDSDLSGVGVLFSGAYKIPEAFLPLPMDISAQVCLVPDPFCFSDSETYLEWRASIGFGIMKGGALILGYRYIKARFDDNQDQWEMSDEMIFLGYQFRY